MKNLKKEIKQLSENQRFLKDQRKSVHIKGERKLEPWIAAYTHKENRSKLRIMYGAYTILRLKELPESEKQFEDKILKLALKYEKVIRTVEQRP